jgi:signal transduction histidine kinase
VFAALAAQDVSAVAHGFRALLAHRTRFVLPVALDLPATLAVVEGLSAAGGFEPQTLAQVLHTGVEDRHGRALEGLQRLLLRRRSAFSQADFDTLLARMVAVSAAVRAPTAELRARAAETSQAAGSDEDIDQTLQVAAVSGAGWASWTAPRGTFDAVPFDASAALEEVARPLRARGLLRPGEALHLDLHGARAQALASLHVRCDGPAFELARADADAAFVWKTALLALTALFAVLAAGLGLSAGRRRQRYLDLKTEFVSTVSHELRTPLASVRALAETLDRRLADEPRARDYPRRIVRAIDGLTGLVENILSFNRLEQDRVKPRLERVALDDLLSAVAEEVADQAPRAVDWQVTGARGLVLQADPALLLLLVSNLCRNGWKYNARDPIALRVHVSRVPAPRPSRPAGLRIEVHDNGQGVPAVAVPHLFTAFYRAPGTSDRRGSGLGLALCWRAAQAHGGRIALAHTSPEGSVFALDLPGEAVQEDSARPEVPAARSE